MSLSCQAFIQYIQTAVGHPRVVSGCGAHSTLSDSLSSPCTSIFFGLRSVLFHFGWIHIILKDVAARTNFPGWYLQAVSSVFVSSTNSCLQSLQVTLYFCHTLMSMNTSFNNLSLVALKLLCFHFCFSCPSFAPISGPGFIPSAIKSAPVTGKFGTSASMKNKMGGGRETEMIRERKNINHRSWCCCICIIGCAEAPPWVRKSTCKR